MKTDLQKWVLTVWEKIPILAEDLLAPTLLNGFFHNPLVIMLINLTLGVMLALALLTHQLILTLEEIRVFLSLYNLSSSPTVLVYERQVQEVRTGKTK